MTDVTQWVATVDDVLAAVLHVPRAGEKKYLVANAAAVTQFFAVAKLRTAGVGVGYAIDDTKVYAVNDTKIINFLTSQGETLPANPLMFVRESVFGQGFGDELVVTDDTLIGRL